MENEQRSVKTKMAMNDFCNGLLVVEGGRTGVTSGSHAPAALQSIDISTTTLTTPSIAEVIENMKEHNIFVFNGHGGSGVCTIDDSNEIQFTYFDAQEGLSETPTHFVLVFLNNCASAAYQTDGWMDALNCDVLVGWDDLVGGNTAEAFDYRFWEEITVPGTSVTTAVNRAWESPWVQLHFGIEQDPGVPVIVGNGGVVLYPCDE